MPSWRLTNFFKMKNGFSMRFKSVIILILLAVYCPLQGESQPQKYPATVNKNIRMFNKGVDHYNKKRYYTSLDFFRKLSNESAKRNSQLTASTLMIMKCYVRINRLDKAKEVGRGFLKSFPESRYAIDVLSTFGNIFLTEGRYRLAVEYYLKARRISDDTNFIAGTDEKLVHLSSHFLMMEEIIDLLSVADDRHNRAFLKIMLSASQLNSGNSDDAAMTLFGLDGNFIPQTFESFHKGLKNRSYKAEDETLLVGVVLPLTGYDAEQGISFLKGIQKALSEIGDNLEIQIAIEAVDNSGDNLKTSACIELLNRNPNVLAIIGPLKPENAPVAAMANKQGNIPLLVPTSESVGLNELSDNVFQLCPNLFEQGQILGQYAVNDLQLKTVAVVAPADKVGQDITDGFVQRADELGAEITEVQWYTGIPLDLSNQFKSLRKTAFEMTEVDIDTNITNISFDPMDSTFMISESDFFPDTVEVEEEMTSRDSSKVVLSSIEGIFMPIHEEDLHLVASQFASYNFDTQLFGNRYWYNPEELNNDLIGPNVNGIVFVSDIFVGNDPAEAMNHDNGQHKLAKMKLLGYDIMHFLGSILKENPKRELVLKALSGELTYSGKGKQFSFSDLYPRMNTSTNLLQYNKWQIKKTAVAFKDTVTVSSTTP